MIAKSHCWQKTAVAAAAFALLGLSTSGALALSLGRMTVYSALGEPLRAEIEVPEINAEEASSLRAGVAQPSAYTAAGMDYNPALTNLQSSLQRRADGRSYIRLSSDKPINDPYVDLILEASWSSGRILRDYTMLFDPPALRKTPSVDPTLPQTATSDRSMSSKATVPDEITPPAIVAPTPTQRSAKGSTEKGSGDTARSAANKQVAPPSQSGDSTRVVVKAGDTAGKIASAHKPVGVSLDQMLVAMLRANPEAFLNNSIHRIRAGAIVDVPTAEQASTISASDASKTVVAQSKDFGAFRRSLAAIAPQTSVEAAGRTSGGAVDTKVEDKKSAAATPDKLTLSKGSLQAKSGEAAIAKERADKEAAARTAELSKNISDLQKLGSAPAGATPPATAASAAKATLPSPAIAVAVPASAATVAASGSQAPVSAPALAVAASAPASEPAVAASAPASAASAEAPAPVPKLAPPPPVPVEPPGFIDELLEDPLLPIGAGGVLAALAGFAFWRTRQRKQQSEMDSSFLESRLQPDSFFGGSGGQRIDTANDSQVTGSSMQPYSPSQLNPDDDVDPVAEADVYLAYGRDLQAEEILNEAVVSNPGRLAIHTKLLEIYAKRRDAKNFEASAVKAYQLTGGNGAEWTRICELGAGVDPTNAMYRAGGAPAEGQASEPVSIMTGFSSTLPQSAHAELPQAAAQVDLDLDLDFSLDDAPTSAISAVTSSAAAQKSEPSGALPSVDLNAPLEMDFDVSDYGNNLGSATSAAASPVAKPDFNATSTMEISASHPDVPAAADHLGMLEFDMDSLSLDLDSPIAEQSHTGASSSGEEDPLETKLALAGEFVSIGDEDGARALIEEVIAESSGDLQIKARRALAAL